MTSVANGLDGSGAPTVFLLHGRGMRASALAPFADTLGANVHVRCPEGPHALPDGTRAWWPPLGESAAPSATSRTAPRTAPHTAPHIAPHSAPHTAPHTAPHIAPHTARDLAERDPPGRAHARRLLATWIGEAAAQRPGAPIVLVGFSQGGMLACDTVLCESVAVAGLALLSSSRIAIGDWRRASARLAGMPVLVAHGRDDRELPFEAGVALRDFAIDAGATVDWLAFDGGHESPLPVWRRLRAWLSCVVAAGAPS